MTENAIRLCRSEFRHLTNRRNTLVTEIIRCGRRGELDRIFYLRQEANKVNDMLATCIKKTALAHYLQNNQVEIVK